VFDEIRLVNRDNLDEYLRAKAAYTNCRQATYTGADRGQWKGYGGFSPVGRVCLNVVDGTEMTIKIIPASIATAQLGIGTDDDYTLIIDR